jgi:dimethylargininase
MPHTQTADDENVQMRSIRGLYEIGHAGPVPRRALVRRPSPRLADGLLTHLDRVPVDVDLAMRQWTAYVDVLRDAGWAIVEVDPADDCPDSVFVEDTVVMYDDLAVITRPGAVVRRPETPGTQLALERLGYRIARIEEPGTLDGGDVLKHGDTVWVGLGGRTNQGGADQLAALLHPLGATIVGVPVTLVLHLKSAVTALPDGTVIGHEPLVDDPSVWPHFFDVPEPDGGHVVVLGKDAVLMASSAPRTRAMLEARGLRCHVVDISEFVKLEGCVTCLSVRLRTDP